MQDQLVECKRCGGNACYEQHIDENTTTWLCMGCGFTTSTVMNEGGKVVADLIATSPELYKDLLFTDNNKRVWAPSTITLPAKGMVFLDGSSKEEWKWAAVTASEITEQDRKIKQFPKDQTHKMDMAGIKHYGQREFMDALELIGFYEIGE
jgi:hypothetical protein